MNFSYTKLQTIENRKEFIPFSIEKLTYTATILRCKILIPSSQLLNYHNRNQGEFRCLISYQK